MNPQPQQPSIRRQLTLRILTGTMALLLLAGLTFFGVIHHRVLGDFDRMLAAEADMLTRNAERKHQTLVWDVPDTYTARSRQNGDAVYCQLFLEDGTVVGLSETLGTDNLPRLPEQNQVICNVRLPDGRRGRMLQRIIVPHSDDTEPQSVAEDPHEQTFLIPATVNMQDLRLTLVVARSREGTDRLLWALGVAGVVVAALLAGGLTLLVRRTITQALLPMEGINAQIAAITPDALTTRLQVAQAPVELAAVVVTVNRLLERIEAAFDKERRFSSDLAHELRTPIAELRTACEVGGRWPENVEATRQFFEDTGKAAAQLERIVATMLMLARCENAQSPTQTCPVTLRSLVDANWQKMAAAAQARQLRFENHVPATLTVACDVDNLGIIVRNLLENAVAHSDPGTVIKCDGNKDASGTELWLANSAVKLERADLDHVFDRFWRKDAARSDRNHVGLGLSITRALCQALDIGLKVDLTEGRLFEVRITFPAAPAARRPEESPTH